MCGKKTVLQCPDYSFPLPHAGFPQKGTGLVLMRQDREAIETMTRDAQNSRNYALSGAEFRRTRNYELRNRNRETPLSR
jgi:hypothetical protein